MTEAIFQDVVKAFGEDRAIIESQQRLLKLDPNFQATATVHDKGLNQARYIIQRALAAEAADGAREDAN